MIYENDSTNNNNTITIIVHIILHSIVPSSLRNNAAVVRSQRGRETTHVQRSPGKSLNISVNGIYWIYLNPFLDYRKILIGVHSLMDFFIQLVSRGLPAE